MAENLPPILVVMALPQESAGAFEAAGIPLLYTGVGKVNAAASLAARLEACRGAGQPMPLVANFGTAGSSVVPAGTLVACRRFIDRDMDATLLGFAPGETPYDPLPPVLEFAPRFAGLPEASCGSGDGFAVRNAAGRCEVVDMEAYALAKACRLAGADFACAKWVSDGAGEGAASEWQAGVSAAGAEFLRLYRQLAPGR